MKTAFIATTKVSGSCLLGVVMTGALVLTGMLPGSCLAGSPVGTTWDLVMSGARDGIAYLAFTDDPCDCGQGTLEGYEIVVPKPPRSPAVKAARGGDASRGDSDGEVLPNSPGPVSTNIFGFVPVRGPWNFDRQGHVIGYFLEVGSVNVTNTFTNTVSFRATALPGRRLTLVASTAFGKVTYRGVPLPDVPLADASGPWYGTKKASPEASQQVFIEFFRLEPSFDFLFNTYDVVEGCGPGYAYEGRAVVSSQRKLAIATQLLSTNQIVRAVIGSFNPARFSSRTRGLEDRSDNSGIQDQISFNVNRQ